MFLAPDSTSESSSDSSSNEEEDESEEDVGLKSLIDSECDKKVCKIMFINYSHTEYFWDN